jgi:putative phosphoesterase
MKIGVLSDTHVSSLSAETIESLKSLNIDLIIHCGDYTGIKVVYQLRALGNFCGVAGNMDSTEIKNILKENEVIEVEGKKIGVVHSHGLFFSDRKMENRFQGEKIDIFIHGHTHRLRNERKGDIYFLNPGSFPESMLIIHLVKDKEIEIETKRLLR